VVISTSVFIIAETIIGEVSTAFNVITEILGARIIVITYNGVVDASDICETFVDSTGVKIAAVYLFVDTTSRGTASFSGTSVVVIADYWVVTTSFGFVAVVFSTSVAIVAGDFIDFTSVYRATRVSCTGVIVITYNLCVYTSNVRITTVVGTFVVIIAGNFFVITSRFTYTGIVCAGIIIVADNIGVIRSIGRITVIFNTFIVTFINNFSMSATNCRFTIINGTCIIIIAVYNSRGATIIWTAIVSITFVVLLTVLRNVNIVTSFIRGTTCFVTFIGWCASLRYICINTAIKWAASVFGTLITIIAIYRCVFTRAVVCTIIITNFFSTSVVIITFNSSIVATIIRYTGYRIASTFVWAFISFIGTSRG